MAVDPWFPSPKQSPISVSTGAHFLSENGYEQGNITSFLPPSKSSAKQGKKIMDQKPNMDAKIKL